MNMSKSTFKLSGEDRLYLAERLKMERGIQAMSQSRLAKSAGFNSSVISLIENARVEMTYSEYEKIAKALSINVPLLVKNDEVLAKIEKYYRIPMEGNTMIEMEAPESIDKQSDEEIIEEIQISDVLIARVNENNNTRYSMTQILNASLNWFASSHEDVQVAFVEKYSTDRAIVKTRLDSAIAEGNFVLAKELLDLYEKISQ